MSVYWQAHHVAYEMVASWSSIPSSQLKFRPIFLLSGRDSHLPPSTVGNVGPLCCGYIEPTTVNVAAFFCRGAFRLVLCQIDVASSLDFRWTPHLSHAVTTPLPVGTMWTGDRDFDCVHFHAAPVIAISPYAPTERLHSKRDPTAQAEIQRSLRSREPHNQIGMRLWAKPLFPAKSHREKVGSEG